MNLEEQIEDAYWDWLVALNDSIDYPGLIHLIALEEKRFDTLCELEGQRIIEYVQTQPRL